MIEEQAPESTSPPRIPLVVDTVRDDLDFPMTRLSYWVIDFDLLEGSVLPEHLRYASIMTMRAKVGLSLGEYVEGGIVGEPFSVPTLYSGMQGILLGSETGTQPRFTADGLFSLLDRIEETDVLTFEPVSLWLPTDYLALSLQEPTRGDVYRVAKEVFLAAWQFKRGRIELDALRERLVDVQGHAFITFSKEETVALQEWTERQIFDMRAKYERMKAAKKPLAYRDEEGGGAL